MAIAFAFLNLAVVLVCCHSRFADDGLQYASPISMGSRTWWAAAIVATVLAGLSAYAGRIMLKSDMSLPSPARARRAMVELLLVFPTFFAFEWLILPPYEWRTGDWLVIGGLVCLVAVMLLADLGNARQWGVGARNFVKAAKLLALPTALMIGLTLLAAARTSGSIKGGQMAIALATYPLYALAQLMIFQVFLVTRLRRVSESKIEIVLAGAAMFALLHWPNPILMLASGAAAAVWTAVYLRRPNVYALALSMGLSAAVFANALSDETTQHMRTGPIYVQRIIDNNQPQNPQPVPVDNTGPDTGDRGP